MIDQWRGSKNEHSDNFDVQSQKVSYSCIFLVVNLVLHDHSLFYHTNKISILSIWDLISFARMTNQQTVQRCANGDTAFDGNQSPVRKDGAIK